MNKYEINRLQRRYKMMSIPWGLVTASLMYKFMITAMFKEIGHGTSEIFASILMTWVGFMFGYIFSLEFLCERKGIEVPSIFRSKRYGATRVKNRDDSTYNEYIQYASHLSPVHLNEVNQRIPHHSNIYSTTERTSYDPLGMTSPSNMHNPNNIYNPNN